MIGFAEDGDGYLWHGILFASAYFLVGVVHTLQDTMSDNVSHTLALKIRTSVCGAIYRKVRIQQQTIYLEESFDFFNYIVNHPFCDDVISQLNIHVVIKLVFIKKMLCLYQCYV